MTIFPPEIVHNTVESHFTRMSSTSKIIYITMLAILIVTLVALPFIYVDITTQASGIIRTPNENTELQSVVYGEVKDIFIEENSLINLGDTLIILNADKIDEQIKREQDKIQENEMFISDISIILNRSENILHTSKYQAEYNSYRSMLADNKTKIAYYKTEYDLYASLYKKEVSPKQEFLKYKNQYENAVNQFTNEKQQYRSNWEAELSRLQIENKEILSSIKQLQEDKINYIIKAPSSGAIIQFTGIQKGSFIAPGQSIAQITPKENLIVECYVSPLDIGYIQEGQDVIFQLSAFDYNQWGLAHGKVKEISRDIIALNNQSVFCVRCKLFEDYLQLESGCKGYLKKGMTLTGRFYLTKRSLWQLLFDNVDDWVNPKILEE